MAFFPATSCFPFHFSTTAVIQFQENHQNRHLVAFVSVTKEDDHWVKIRPPFQGDGGLH
jgi:hypothetical protein